MRQELRVLILTGLISSGCASGPPPPPPVLDLANRECGTAPDLSLAVDVALNPKKRNTVSTVVDETTPCVETPDGLAAYALYRLPESDNPYVVEIASDPVGGVMFVPRIRILDQNGEQLQEVTRDRLVFRDAALSVQRRSRAEDRYVLVMSDPTLVGKKFSRMSATTDSTTSSTGTVTFMIYSGADKTVDLIFAHNGKIDVSVWPIEPAK